MLVDRQLQFCGCSDFAYGLLLDSMPNPELTEDLILNHEKILQPLIWCASRQVDN